jgi:hypothetical protein
MSFGTQRPTLPKEDKMTNVRARAVFVFALTAILAPAALAYIHSYSGALTGAGDVDTFSFTTDAATIEIEFNCFTEARLEVDVTRDGKYLCTFGVDGFAGVASLVDVRDDERDTGNVRVEDVDGQAHVRIKGGGEFYVAVSSKQGSAEWGFTWSEAKD